MPKSFALLLQSQGYDDLYPPQEESVKGGLLEGRSLLLATPTASGKTLVSILAAIRAIMNGGKVVYLSPLRALASEKFQEFKILENMRNVNGQKAKVLISTGDYDSSGESLRTGDLMVLTNEKFDALLRHRVSWLNKVKLFIADEIHLLGEGRRGPTIEMILAKVLALRQDVQILGLSATITNADEVARWLGANLIKSEWRPVPLIEGIHAYGRIQFKDGREILVKETGRGAPIDVAIDNLKEGGQSLIFAETRRRAVSIAKKAAEVVEIVSKEEQHLLRELADQVNREGDETELRRRLADLISKGVAFHHAGLSANQRRIVERGFRARAIKILAATPTLAAGVNLPARRVVISSVYRYNAEFGGQDAISVLDYKQMCGRAGRPKYDDLGEAVVLAGSEFEKDGIAEKYLAGQPEPLTSQLAEISPLRFHLLATITSQSGATMRDLEEVFTNTLLSAQKGASRVGARLGSALDYLVAENLVIKRNGKLTPTQFGKKVSMLYITPETGVLFRRAMKIWEPNLDHEVGVVQLIVSTPDFSPKFSPRGKDWESTLDFVEEHRDKFLQPGPDQEGYDPYSGFFEGFRMVRVLHAWVEEWTEDRILRDLGIEPGDLHRAVESASWLAYSLRETARVLRRPDLLPEISRLDIRIRSGVKVELLPLVGLEMIGRSRARELYRAGFTDLKKLSVEPIEKLARVPKIGMTIASGIKRQIAKRV